MEPALGDEKFWRMSLMLMQKITAEVSQVKIDPEIYKKSTAELWRIIESYGPEHSPFMIPPEDSDADAKKKVENYYPEVQKSLLKGDDLGQIRRKTLFQQNFGWWVPTPEIIKIIAQITLEIDSTGVLLEVGCGRALGARLLQEYDRLRVIATDVQVGERVKNKRRPVKIPTFTAVENLDALGAINKYPEAKTILMAWPPIEIHPGYEMSWEVVKHFKGQQIIYIGEPADCATGHPEFFRTVQNPRLWTLYRKVPVKRWPDTADSMYIYRRVTP